MSNYGTPGETGSSGGGLGAPSGASPGSPSLTEQAAKTYSQAQDAVRQGSETISHAAQDAYSSAKDMAAPIAGKVADTLQSTYGQARDAATAGAKAASQQLRENPTSSLLGVAAACFFLGWILGRPGQRVSRH